MGKTASSCLLEEGWEPPKKPRCRSCGGETVKVLAKYGTNKPRLEWECMLCGKSFRADGNVSYERKGKKKRYTNKPRKKYGRK